MPEQLTPRSIRDIGIFGVIRTSEVEDHLIPDGAVTDVVNFSFDQKGTATLRTGVATLGGTISAGNNCLGIFNNQSGTLTAAFISAGSIRISEWSGAAWNTLYTGTGGSTPVRSTDFAGRTVYVSGLERSAFAWNGSGLDTVNAVIETSGNPINLQQLWYVNGDTNAGRIRPKYIEVYKSVIYLAGDSVNPDRLFYSAVISSAGNVSWTPATSFIDINPSDGENITALKRYALELLLFKPNYIYRFKTTGVDPDPLIKVGTRSQESVIEGKKGLYFFHESGFYKYTGGYPIEISRPISDIVAAIPYSQYSIMPAWKDTDHIYWYLGNITVNDPQKENVTYNSVVARYTESSEIWTIYSYPFGLLKGTTFDSGSGLSQVVGLNTGVVGTFNSGNTDLSEPIVYRLTTKWYEWDSIDTQKIIMRLIALAIKPQGCTLMYQTDYDLTTWKELGQLKKQITTYQTLSLKFRSIRFKWAGMSSVEALIIQGLEIPTIIKDAVVK